MFQITRVYENDKIIIYKRLFDLRNCCGSKRYFETSKRDGYTQGPTGKEFKSIAQVKKYIRERGEQWTK